MRTVALLTAICWAQFCSTYFPCPQCLRFYLAASLAANVGIIVTWHLFPENSLEYAVLYCLLTAANLAAAYYVAWDRLSNQWHAAIGYFCAVIVTALAYNALPKPLHYYAWIAIVEGAALALAGTTLLFSAAHWPMNSIYFSLALLWLAQCVFRLDFILNVKAQAWLNANEYVPIVLVCLALGWVGYRLKAQGSLVEGKP